MLLTLSVGIDIRLVKVFVDGFALHWKMNIRLNRKFSVINKIVSWRVNKNQEWEEAFGIMVKKRLEMPTCHI